MFSAGEDEGYEEKKQVDWSACFYMPGELYGVWRGNGFLCRFVQKDNQQGND